MNKPAPKTASERRLVENEIVFRQLNEQIQKGIDEANRIAAEDEQSHLRIQQSKDDDPLHFYCECADENCVRRVVLSHHDYNTIHRRRDHFVILPGHERPQVEDVVQREEGYFVVEKKIMPPEQVGSVFDTEAEK